jgi:SAM-dependent methyltransferase
MLDPDPVNRLKAPLLMGGNMTSALTFDPGRIVGAESMKSYRAKVETGFWSKYVNGPSVLDIGFRGAMTDAAPIVEGALGIDLDFPGYDGRTLPFEDESQDAVYSSHCLEHVEDPVVAIREWHRVTKLGGHIITVVPHAYLYERRMSMPSNWSCEHLRVYTPGSLLTQFEEALQPNTYRVRHLCDNDEAYGYADPPTLHPRGCYEIELVVEKISPPEWPVEH